MSEKEQYVEVKIPKAMAEGIRRQPWFKYYKDVEDFVVEAVREHLSDKYSTFEAEGK